MEELFVVCNFVLHNLSFLLFCFLGIKRKSFFFKEKICRHSLQHGKMHVRTQQAGNSTLFIPNETFVVGPISLKGHCKN